MKKTLIMVCAAASTLKISAKEAPNKQPNIIWITCEDISPYIGAYGDKVVKTPNIDRLIQDGKRYDGVYTVSGVSSPSRSCFITGMYPISIGTQHMRTLMPEAVAKKRGLNSYSAVIPEYVKCFPEYLRMNGYFTSNNVKTDYQFIEPVTVWDENNESASYNDCPKGKPFFSVFNLFITHESQIASQSKRPLLVDAKDVNIPPYYPDTYVIRKDIAQLMTNIERMDQNVGEIIKQLKKDGMYDNSYIFFFSDHGGCLPWMKREILERGTHIPFVIKFPKGVHAGTQDNKLISSVDFAPTVLSIAGVKIPSYMQGQAFLGKQAVKIHRKYVFAARDRMDECVDRVRSVRDNQFRYIYNYHPESSHYQDISYRLEAIPMMKEMIQLHREGKLTPNQEAWFTPFKPVEELYDVSIDPNELHNLADDLKYQKKLVELRLACKQWLNRVGDMSAVSEKEMIAKWWNGKDHTPVTEKPKITVKNGLIKLSCKTIGASIGYRILKAGEQKAAIIRKARTWDMGYANGTIKEGQDIKVSPVWNVYTGENIKLEKGDKIIVQAMRIGYTPATSEYLQGLN